MAGATVPPPELTIEMPLFQLATEIEAPAEACFDLARSIDLHLESMVASKERAVGGVTSGLIGAGEEVSIGGTDDLVTSWGG